MMYQLEETKGNETALRDWERRKEFTGFTEEDARLLQQLAPVVEAFIDDVVEELYRRLLQFDETRTFFADPTVLTRVKAAQRTYFLDLTGGDYGEKYLANRRLIGRVHQQVGLPPRWYMGAHSLYMQLVFPRVMEAVKPAHEAQRAFGALFKLATLDMEIAISTYIDARDEVISRQAHELMEAQRSLHEAERFAVLGEIAGTMAHELSQPLQVINIACAAATAELADAVARRGTPDGVYIQERLDRIARQIDTTTQILRDLRSFVREVASEQPEPFDPAAAVRHVVKLTEYGVHHAQGRLSVQLGEGLPSVAGSIGRFEQALISLINSGRDCGGRSFDIVVEPLSRGDDDFVRVIVGVSSAPDDITPRLFPSPAAVGPRNRGRGLGFRICRRIVEEMRGEISVESRSGGDIKTIILLPVAGASVAGPERPAP